MSATIAIEREALREAERRVRSRLRVLPLASETALPALRTLTATYDALVTAGSDHHGALYVALRETLRTRPEPGDAHEHERVSEWPPYPERASDIARGCPWSAERLYAYCAHILPRARERAREGDPRAYLVAGRTYTIHAPSAPSTPVLVKPTLVGLERETADIQTWTQRLFCYAPSLQDNPAGDRFPRTVLLAGPPGTGKSSLVAGALTEAQRLASVTGTRLTIERYDASDLSSYFGRSSKVMAKKLAAVQHPSGVGIAVLEDIDLVLPSRDSGSTHHAKNEVQQVLWNALSGITARPANTMVYCTSNAPDQLDQAFRSRLDETVCIDPFRDARAHVAYLETHLGGAPDANPQAFERLGSRTHALAMRGRELDALVRAAKREYATELSDDMIQLLARGDRDAHERHRARGQVSVAALERMLAARTAAQYTLAP